MSTATRFRVSDVTTATVQLDRNGRYGTRQSGSLAVFRLHMVDGSKGEGAEWPPVRGLVPNCPLNEMFGKRN